MWKFKASELISVLKNNWGWGNLQPYKHSGRTGDPESPRNRKFFLKGWHLCSIYLSD